MRTITLLLLFALALLAQALPLIPLPAEINHREGSFSSYGGVYFQTLPRYKAELAPVVRYLNDVLLKQQLDTTQYVTAPYRNVITLNYFPGLYHYEGEEYALEIEESSCVLTAGTPAGLFRAVTTLSQLIAARATRGEMTLPAVSIEDAPRFAYRGYMLDPARNWLTVAQLKQEIDRMVLWKLNVLHLHLTDDQGWRVEVPGWPALTEKGSDNDVGADGPGVGKRYYTVAQLREIAQYAADRFVSIVPEIDFPGHTNELVRAYPELCKSDNGYLPSKYAGIGPVKSWVDVYNPKTYELLRAAITTVLDATGATYLHIGGDEPEGVSKVEYAHALNSVQSLLAEIDSTVTLIGWEEIAAAALDSGTAIAQYWQGAHTAEAAAAGGAQLILSPVNHCYLDMKYSAGAPADCGLTWSSAVSLKRAYEWNPAAVLAVDSGRILGVEAPLWGETVESQNHLEQLAYPRLLAFAEVAWTPQAARQWDGFKRRLQGQLPLLKALDIEYFPAPELLEEEAVLTGARLEGHGLVSVELARGRLRVPTLAASAQLQLFSLAGRVVSRGFNETGLSVPSGGCWLLEIQRPKGVVSVQLIAFP